MTSTTEGVTGLPFEKWEGAGNDFVVADARPGAPWHRILADEASVGTVAAAACDRHFGIGADGLLLAAADPVAGIAMRMWNPDGSESEMCGNGLRCFGAWLHARGEYAPGRHRVATGAGILAVCVAPGGAVSVEMGRPVLAAAEVPVAGASEGADGITIVRLPGWAGHDLEATCVSMGNPHAVVFVDDAGAVPLAEVGPTLERHPAFPRRANVEFCEVTGPASLAVRVWERGAGATLACGTGACAVMVAARLHGRVGPVADIRLPGGTLHATWRGRAGDVDHEVTLGGPARHAFTGTWFGA